MLSCRPEAQLLSRDRECIFVAIIHNQYRETYRGGNFFACVYVFLSFGGLVSWLCQLVAWNCQPDVWNCQFGVWNCLLGVWNCLLGVWICQLCVPYQCMFLLILCNPYKMQAKQIILLSAFVCFFVFFVLCFFPFVFYHFGSFLFLFSFPFIAAGIW